MEWHHVVLPTDSPRTDHLCVNVDGPSDDRMIELDINASVGVKARCCHSPGFYPGLRYHSFSTVGGFKVQGMSVYPKTLKLSELGI